ncbi:uncharacterized protein LOC109849703 [Asparagus officinalis]|uniref:uncharacterized protein LOC109849703 n=1 Tax=Asparagus officinalis TaxID=4686 RepID=UPI00098E18A5|nr:uncharacterized protein LOC109849703 [Asparagus officinalis]XP_020275160.1 uncharacterized protein LOC109849703 [Asparagus officinalis]XP_020275161.1 uncharacterized protein LOC109849703 [Asparagus officinalis]
MSLVDYASSSDDEDEKIEEKTDEIIERGGEEKKAVDSSASIPPSDRQNQNNMTSSSLHQPSIAPPVPPPQMEKLPDASLLFSSSFSSNPTMMFDHSSRVAAAIGESRKRETNGSSLVSRQSKQPRGSLPHSRNIPDTVGSKLIPPQLRGRSNVVTEDINKLFVRKDGQNISRRD